MGNTKEIHIFPSFQTVKKEKLNFPLQLYKILKSGKTIYNQYLNLSSKHFLLLTKNLRAYFQSESQQKYSLKFSHNLRLLNFGGKQLIVLQNISSKQLFICHMLKRDKQ